MDKQTEKLLTITAIAAAGYFLVVKPILQAIGLQDSPEDKKNQTSIDAAGKSNAFNPTYWRTATGQKSLLGGNPTVSAVADMIKNAWGTFNDNEEQVYAAFRYARSKTMVSQLADSYRQKFGVDLFQDLKKRLSEKEMATVTNYVNALPDKVAR